MEDVAGAEPEVWEAVSVEEEPEPEVGVEEPEVGEVADPVGAVAVSVDEPLELSVEAAELESVELGMGGVEVRVTPTVAQSCWAKVSAA